MGKLRRAVAHHQLVGHAHLGQGFALKLVGVNFLGSCQVQLHVDERAGQKLGGREALVERAGLVDTVYQGLRNGLAGLVMQGKFAEHLGRGQPVFEQLRGEFHVVAYHAGTREGGVRNVARQPMQGVAELVKQRGGVGPGNEYGLAGLALHEVRVVRHDGRHGLTVHALLVAVGIHPGPRVFAGAGVRVEVPEAHLLAGGFVVHLPHLHIRMVHGYIGHGHEGEIEQLAGYPEHSLAHLIELQILFHLVLVEVVAGLAHLLGVVAVVPGLKFEVGGSTLLFGQGQHVGHFLVHAGHGGFPHLLHQLHSGFGRFGHGVVEAQVGVSGVAQQLGALGPQLQNLGNDGVVVVCAAVVAPVREHPPGLLAQLALVRIGQERVDAGTRVGDDARRRNLTAGGRGFGRVAQRSR